MAVVGEYLFLIGAFLLLIIFLLSCFMWFQKKIEGEHYLFDDDDLFEESEIDYRTRHE